MSDRATPRPAENGVTRRDLFKQAGVAAAGAAALGSTAARAAASPQDNGGHGDGGHGDRDAPESQRLRRWAMVIDLRRCDGCMSLGVPPQCTQQCIWSRLAPEQQQWVEIYEFDDDHEPTEQGFMPVLCMQCENAPCVNVCPVGATFHTPGGVVLIDQERCIGCRLCMAACPYDARFFNWEEPVQMDWVKEAPYNVQTQVPAMKGTVMKCDFCTDKVSVGGLPACVEACPEGAFYFGDLEEDIATNGTEVVNLSRFLKENNAFHYKEDLGTKPRVYYIPGHGEDVGKIYGPTDYHEEDGHHEPSFMKDKLEWPWEKIARATNDLLPKTRSNRGADGHG